MWCKGDGCDCYDEETDSCTRISNNGEMGVCWMEKGEGEY